MAIPRIRVSWAGAAAVLGVAVFGFILFGELTEPGRILFTSDDNIGHIAMRKAALPGAMGGGWWDGEAMGQPMILNHCLTYVLLQFMPVEFFHNWIRWFHLFWGSICFMLFLRERRRSWPAAAFGAGVAFWVGQFTIFTYGGHLGKCGALAFVGLFLWSTAVAARTRRWGWMLAAGVALGGIFAEQADMGLIFGLGLGLYPIHAWAIRHGLAWKGLTRFAATIYLTGFLAALPSLWAGYSTAVKDVTVVRGESPAEKWNYITQWSLPPEDLIDLVAPHYHGIRSGDPVGPYWGRVGRTEGWERTGEGFMNFRLDSPYVGLFPVALALFALAAAARTRFRRRSGGAAPSAGGVEHDVLFFGLMALLSIAWAMGRYSPLYRLLYQLPVISDVRAPVKFLQPAQMAIAVMAAFGFDFILRGLPAVWIGDGRARGVTVTAPEATLVLPIGLRVIPWVWAALAFLLAVTAWTLMNLLPSQLAAWAASWGEDAAKTILHLRAQAVWHAAFMAALAAAGLAALLRRSRGRGATVALAGAGLLLLGVDAWRATRPYIETFPRSHLTENDVFRVLNDNPGHHRVTLPLTQGFYNHWLTIHFPYYGVATTAISQMPRMADDYRQWFSAGGEDFEGLLRVWECMASRWILVPQPMARELLGHPVWGARLVRRLDYDVRVGADQGLAVIRAAAGAGAHVILEWKDPVPRVFLAGRWRVQATAGEQLRAAVAPEHDLRTLAHLGPDAATAPAPFNTPSESAEPFAGRAVIEEYRSGRIRVRLDTAAPALLRVIEKYDAGWTARVDGQPAPVWRGDYIGLAVPVPAGAREAVIEWRR
jgi:hypothetical protein